MATRVWHAGWGTICKIGEGRDRGVIPEEYKKLGGFLDCIRAKHFKLCTAHNVQNLSHNTLMLLFSYMTFV